MRTMRQRGSDDYNVEPDKNGMSESEEAGGDNDEAESEEGGGENDEAGSADASKSSRRKETNTHKHSLKLWLARVTHRCGS